LKRFGKDTPISFRQVACASDSARLAGRLFYLRSKKKVSVLVSDATPARSLAAVLSSAISGSKWVWWFMQKVELIL